MSILLMNKIRKCYVRNYSYCTSKPSGGRRKNPVWMISSPPWGFSSNSIRNCQATIDDMQNSPFFVVGETVWCLLRESILVGLFVVKWCWMGCSVVVSIELAKNNFLQCLRECFASTRTPEIWRTQTRIIHEGNYALLGVRFEDTGKPISFSPPWSFFCVHYSFKDKFFTCCVLVSETLKSKYFEYVKFAPLGSEERQCLEAL